IGIKAPKNIPVHRQEIFKAILKENELAAQASEEALEVASKAIFKKISRTSF
ncbi:MAG: carbon storage regulator, partial [Rubrobacteridae bacterium]|nr:carbon storage regulator [Rubrobacteridae bacterium]